MNWLAAHQYNSVDWNINFQLGCEWRRLNYILESERVITTAGNEGTCFVQGNQAEAVIPTSFQSPETE